MLVISIFVPWVGFEVKMNDTGKSSQSSLSLFTELTNAGPFFITTLVLMCMAILTGIISLAGLIVWSKKRRGHSLYWCGLTVILIVLAIIVFNVPHPIYHKETTDWGDFHVGNIWVTSTTYPHAGFYLDVFSIIIFIVVIYLARNAGKIHSISVR